jgi:hypothetical protein
MMRILAFSFLVSIQALAPVEAKDFIDIAIACTPRASMGAKSRLEIKTDDGSVECVDADAYVRDVSIKEGQLRYAESLDLYMLFLFVDQADKPRLAEFTNKHLNRRMFILKGGVIVVSGWLAAPMVNGYINIGVPDKNAGNSVMDKLIPPRLQ